MKLKPVSLVVLVWTVALAACAPVHETAYWKHLNNGAPALPLPQANVLLKKDLAACSHAIDEMDKNDPAADDFDGCMLGEGWMRQNVTQPSRLWLKADDDQQKSAAPQNPATHVTVPKPKPQSPAAREKQQQTEEISHDMRQDDLVPPGGKVTIGVQGYQDRYTAIAHGTNDNIHTNYYGGTAGYTYRYTDHNFWTIDGRLARGLESYNSPLGVMDDVPAYESEARFTLGHDYAYDAGWISAYGGFGGRLFRDGGKGHVTNLGVADFDTRIEQLYAPIGVTWHSLLGQFTMADTLEVDPLLLGRVDQRAQNLGGPNVVTTQGFLTGYGIRGEAMFGIPFESASVELGPFFRYWNINDSSVNIQSCGGGGLCQGYVEPYNTRVQIGVTTRVSF